MHTMLTYSNQTANQNNELLRLHGCDIQLTDYLVLYFAGCTREGRGASAYDGSLAGGPAVDRHSSAAFPRQTVTLRPTNRQSNQ